MYNFYMVSYAMCQAPYSKSRGKKESLKMLKYKVFSYLS